MRIAMIVGGFPTVSETFILNQIIGLIQRGHQIQIFAYHKGDDVTEHEDIKKYNLLKKTIYKKKLPVTISGRVIGIITWIWNNFPDINWKQFLRTLNFIKFRRQAYTLELFYIAQWFLNCSNFDIIHAHFGHNAREVAHLKKKGFLQDSKFVVTFHGYDLNPSYTTWYKKIYRTIFEYANVFTVNTLYLKELLQNVNCKLENIEVLPVGVNMKIFDGAVSNQENEYFRILFCGRLISLKGPDLAINIVHDLIQKGYKNLRLEIIGEGELLTSLQNMVKELDLLEVVNFHGALSQREVRNIMEKASVFLLPGINDSTGRAETQGLVIQEAQAMKLPVIISNVGGMKYGIIDGKTGFVVVERNIQGFSMIIENLIQDTELRNFIGKKALEFVREKYDSNLLVDSLVEIYHNATDSER